MTALLKIIVQKIYYLFGNATPKQPLNQEINWKKKLLAYRTKKILSVPCVWLILLRARCM